MHCPHCHLAIPAPLIERAYGKLRAGSLPHRITLRPCAHCGESLGAREWRTHVPKCRKNPRIAKRGRP